MTLPRIPFNRVSGDFPVTESVSDRLLHFPLFASIFDAEQDHVLSVVTSF